MGDIRFNVSPEHIYHMPLNKLRPCQPSHTDPWMQYSDRERVEVRYCLCAVFARIPWPSLWGFMFYQVMFQLEGAVVPIAAPAEAPEIR